MRKVIFRILYLPQLLLLVMLIFMHYIPTVSPAEYQLMGVLGLLTPVVAVLNIAFLFFWLIARKYLMVGISLLGLFISWNVISVGFGFGCLKTNDAEVAKDFSIMSYNVRLLDLYDWTGDKNNRIKLLDFISSKSPDILCLQEFYTKDGTGLDNIKAIKEKCGYPYVETCALKRHANRLWGSVIFSKFPIVKNTNVMINEDDKNLLQEAIIDIGKDRLRVYNIHLHSNKLSPQDMSIQNDSSMLQTAKSALKSSRSVFTKLLKAYKQRGVEADLSGFVIDESNEYPTIVCGDLNDLPSSYSYFNVKGQLEDAFLERGCGVGSTYRGKISFLRIDYMFFSNRLRIKYFDRFLVPYSDHLPLMGSFDL